MRNLERFLYVQNRTHEQAVEEIRNGKKISHWMWYTFPQIQGLGESDYSVFYAIDDLDEATRYLNHNILGPRLKKISQELLKLKINDPVEIFGKLDSLKLKSCMTLFAYIEKNGIFEEVLNKYYEGEKDEKTIQILERTYRN